MKVVGFRGFPECYGFLEEVAGFSKFRMLRVFEVARASVFSKVCQECFLHFLKKLFGVPT